MERTSTPRVARARLLLHDFLERTGVTDPTRTPHRYLWTDAFAVSTLLELARIEGEPCERDAALELVDQVHGVLGRHRPDDLREGWLSGLPEAEGRRHPTLGGLRIGKPLPERSPGAVLDERREWDRDGQYFHYLTRWMQALARAAEAAGDPARLRQAIELARTAHARFTVRPAGGGPRRLVWKMSVDLSRPLVPSSGQHDALDGLLTFRALQARARRAGLSSEAAGLDDAVHDLRAMAGRGELATADPLGLGGLLGDALRLAELLVHGPEDARLLPELLDAAAWGMEALRRGGALAVPAAERLPFRELGLAIGLRALPRLRTLVESGELHLPARVELGPRLERLEAQAPLADSIERCWLTPANLELASWSDHEDIDSVMLAALLLPDGVLGA
jgi:hypothetical protein